MAKAGRGRGMVAGLRRGAVLKELTAVLAAAKKSGSATAGLASIETWLKNAIKASGACTNKDWLLAKYDSAVDAVLAIDMLPATMAWLEPMLDRAAASWAKARGRAIVNKVCS